MAGRTDPIIIADACEKHGIEGGFRVRELHERYFACLREELPRETPGRRILPGVVELLDALHGDESSLLGLLTGNLATSARLKLEQFGLWRYFRAGAFGDDGATRNDLVPVAAERVAGLGHPRPMPSQTIVIGDTVHDVACARAGGARSLAVATGSCRRDELHAAGADAVLDDLSQTAVVLRLLDELVEVEPAGS